MHCTEWGSYARQHVRGKSEGIRKRRGVGALYEESGKYIRQTLYMYTCYYGDPLTFTQTLSLLRLSCAQKFLSRPFDTMLRYGVYAIPVLRSLGTARDAERLALGVADGSV